MSTDIKSWLFSDQLGGSTAQNGLSVYNIKYMAMARGFLETAVHTDFLTNQHNNSLVKQKIEEVRVFPDPATDPYLSEEAFVNLLKKMGV